MMGRSWKGLVGQRRETGTGAKNNGGGGGVSPPIEEGGDTSRGGMSLDAATG